MIATKVIDTDAIKAAIETEAGIGTGSAVTAVMIEAEETAVTKDVRKTGTVMIP